MADKPTLAVDKAGLQAFVNNQIAPFEDTLDKIANKVDAEATPTMDGLLGMGTKPADEDDILTAQAPLAIGRLKADTGTGGQAIVDAITASAKSISAIYLQQIKLFGDLDKYLTATITKLMDEQHDSLTKIDGKIFLDGLGTVPGDFSGSGSGTTTTT